MDHKGKERDNGHALGEYPECAGGNRERQGEGIEKQDKKKKNTDGGATF